MLNDGGWRVTTHAVGDAAINLVLDGYDAANSDRSIVGRDVRLNGEAYRVVGVMPADFEVPARPADVLVPFSFTPAQMSDNARGNEFSSMIARLRWCICKWCRQTNAGLRVCG